MTPARLSCSVLSCMFLLHLSLAAPGQPGTSRVEDTSDELINPFQSGEDSHRLLQSYIASISKEEDQGKPEINSWEQGVFYLFHLHDYDHSGFLDGLEMIRLLSDYNAVHRPAVVLYDKMVSLVDFLLQTQDLNQDGLFTPSELLSPPLQQTQNKEHPEVVLEQNGHTKNEVAQKIEHVVGGSPVSVDEQHTPHKVQVQTGKDEQK
ncbi:unnamed protein product [Knipowitschia caucasica]